MALAQSNSNILLSENNIGLEQPLGHQGLTPPNNSTKGTTTSQAIAKKLHHLFGIFLEVLDLTNQAPPNTPVCQDQSLPRFDKVRQVLESVSAELYGADKPSQSLTSDEHGKAPSLDAFGVKHPIYTTPEDFESFEKWASPQFKIVKET